MWRPHLLGILCAIAGCGPLVVLPEDSESGTDSAATSGGTTDTTTLGSDPGSSGAMSTVGTLPPVSTSGVTFDVPPSDDSGSTGSQTDLCASITPLFEVPEEGRLFVVDQDGDGLEELWLSFFEGGGPGSQTELFRIFPEGIPIPGGSFPGFITGFHDIDGDGIRDGVGFAFGGGGPPSLSFIPGTPDFIEGMPIPTTFGFEDGFEAFGDASGDGRADFIRNRDGVLELLLGDGNGNFELFAEAEANLLSDVSWTPIEGSVLSIIAETEFFDALDTCVPKGFRIVQTDVELFAVASGGSPQRGFDFSAPLWGIEQDNGPIVFGRACDPNDPSRVTIQAQRLPFNGEPIVEEYEPASLATMGDVDGDGNIDVVLGRLSNDGVVVHLGTGPGTFSAAQGYDVDFDQTVPTRVYTVDIDLDGREEIILGTRDGGSEIVYHSIDLDPC